MAISFPTSIDSLSDPETTSALSSPSHAGQHTDLNDIAEALEAKVGADSSATTTSHDYKLGSVTSTAKAVSTAGAQSIAGKKTFVSTVGTIKTDTDGATVTFDLDVANIHQVTLGGNRTLAIDNEDSGQVFIIRLVQDGTGSRTVTWFSTIKWAGGVAPTLTTTASGIDVFGFITTGTDTYDGFVIGQALASV